MDQERAQSLGTIYQLPQLLHQQPIAYPRLPAINSHMRTVEQASTTWALHHGLLRTAADTERLRRQGWSQLIARTYPHASLAALQWISDWFAWGGLFDDQCDNAMQGHEPEQLAEFQIASLAILRGGVPKQDHPMFLSLYDLATRLRTQADPIWLERFIQHHDKWLGGCVWEAANRVQHQIPDLASYLSMRRQTGAVYPCLALIEFENQLHLPAVVHVHPTVQQLVLSTNDILCWSNDLISLDKELQVGDTHNLVIVLCQAYGCSQSAAIDRVMAMHDAEVHRFQTLAAQLPSFTPRVDADLQRYVVGIQSWIRGHMDWIQDSKRFQLLVSKGAVDIAR